MHEFIRKIGGSGSTEPPKKDESASKQIYLMDKELSELPESPDCPSLIALYLQRNYDLTAIPPLFFHRMPLLQVLDLSNTSIKSLPKSLPKLVALKKLFLRGCKLFMILSPQVGKLSNLEELDLDETQLMNLPVDIGKLGKLRLLKVSIYGHKNFSKRMQLQSSTVIHPETISNLSQLTELSIDVDPSDKWWGDSVETIVKGVCNSKGLRSLSLYLPKFQLLDYASLLYPSLPYFRFIVGHHKRRVISRVPHEAEVEFRKWHKCLKFVNGENIPFQIREVLKFSTSFFLDRHANAMNLSGFGNENMKMLKFCLLVECNKMEAIIDRSELSPGPAENVLESLQYLSVYYMNKLESIWKGPTHYGCMSKLKFLELHSCPLLSNIFSQALLENFVNLEEFTLEDCPRVTSLVSHVSVKPTSNTFLPNLKRLLLLYLPELVSISNGLFIAPRLQRIGFYNCPNLKSFSKRELSSKTLKMIKGENQWWEDIKWNETEWGTRPDHLMHIFSPINNEKDVMTQLVEDSDLFEALIPNDGEHSDDAKLLDIVTKPKGQWPDCTVERTRTDSVTKSIPQPSLCIPPSMSLPYLTIPQRLNVENPSGFSKTSGQLPDFLNSPGYELEENCLDLSLSSSLVRVPNFSNSKATIATNKNINTASSTSSPPPFISSRYESQKHRDWSTFCQYLKNQKPPLSVSTCSSNNVIEFLRYLDQFGKTKVHISTCPFFGMPDQPAPCPCPLRQAWASLDALIGRLSTAYEERGGRSEMNPFGTRAVRIYLGEVRYLQGKAREISYKKRKQSDQKIAPSTQPAQAKFADAVKSLKGMIQRRNRSLQL